MVCWMRTALMILLEGLQVAVACRGRRRRKRVVLLVEGVKGGKGGWRRVQS